MGIKLEDLLAKGYIVTNEHPIASQLPDPKPQCDQAPALDTTVPGEKKSDGRIVVRFVGYRIRPLDPDNFAGGCKDLLDGLRHAQILSGDEPDKIIFVTEQVKVAHRQDERTEIELTDEKTRGMQ